jgi:hypothetical protein
VYSERPGLPAISAVAAIPAVSPVSTASTTTPAASAVPPAVPATSAAVATASAASTTPPAALCLGPGFVHHQIASAEILTIQRINRAVRIFVIGHFHEGETTRLPRKAVPNQIDTRWTDTHLRKPLLELLFCRGKRKVTYVELLHLPTPSARNPIDGRQAR